MIESMIAYLGPWNWWILAILLMGLEILAPGTFFLWFGISAFVIGTISLAVGQDSAFWVWQTQMIGFVILSLVSALFGRKFMARYNTGEEEANLNRRGEQLVGQTVRLSEAISEGRGRTKIGDTTWRIAGPDLPSGTRVRIVEAKAGALYVEQDERAKDPHGQS